MGTKENFLQAMRELTGSSKEEKKNDGKSTVDGMRNAVAAEDTSEFMAVNEAAAENNNVIDDFEEIERRAAMAAENLNRQQDSFTQGSYADDNNTPAEPVESPIRFNEPPQPQYAQQPRQQYTPPQPPLFSQQQYAQAQQQSNTYNQASQNPYAQQFAGGQTPPPPPQSPQPGIYSNPEPNSFSTASYSQVDENEMTVISRNTVIDGNVRSFANMSIDGNIKGNVETTKDIDLNGKIVGNIACNNASLRTSQIQGNIQMKGNAFMERDTLLIGDLSSTYANVNGKIKGNMSITGKAELKSDAVVFGDISASTITVNDGAIIQGYVSTTFLNKEESKNIFPEAITIGD